MRKGFAFFVLVTLLTFTLAGWGTATTSTAVAQEAKVLRYVYSFGPYTLDTSLVTDNQGGVALYNTSAGLLRYYDGQVKEELASSYDVSEDQLTYTFHLRDAVWEDGIAITAADFEYSFKRLLTPETGAPMAFSAYMIKNAEAFNTGAITDWAEVGVKATDEKTFVIELAAPVPYFAMIIATSSSFYPLRQDFVEAAGDAYGTDDEHFLASGPFVLESYLMDQSITYVKNENYWDADSINLDQIVNVFSMDANTNVAMFDNDEIDLYLEIKPVDFPNYDPGEAYSQHVLRFLQFNAQGMTEETGVLMSNVNFRKALTYAFDRQSFITAIEGANAPSTVATRIASPVYPGVTSTYVEENPIEGMSATYDPDKAKEYLALALEELGMSIDQIPELTYVTFEGDTMKTYAEALLDAWNRVLGLDNITVQQLPIPTAIQTLYQGQFDIYLQSMSLDVDPSVFLEYFTTGNEMNLSYWSDSEYDALFEAANAIFDTAERNQALAAAEQYLLDNGPLGPLYHPGAYTGLVKDGFVGLVTSGLGAPQQYIYADKVN